MPKRFPAPELRDALGFVRLLYAARLTGGRAVRGQPDPLVDIGKRLGAALGAARAANGAPTQVAAIEDAGAALAKLADELTAEGVRDAVVVARARVMRPAR